MFSNFIQQALRLVRQIGTGFRVCANAIGGLLVAGCQVPEALGCLLPECGGALREPGHAGVKPLLRPGGGGGKSLAAALLASLRGSLQCRAD